MANEDWADIVLPGDDDGVSQSFRPTTIGTTIDEIRSNPELSDVEIERLVNEAICEEALNLRYGKTMYQVEVDALRLHVDSPSVVSPDPNSRYVTTPEELEGKAVEIEARGVAEYEDGRRLLVDAVRKLHEQGFGIDRTTFGDLSSLDEDGYVTGELCPEGGSLLDLAHERSMVPRRNTVAPVAVDFSRDVTGSVDDRSLETMRSVDPYRQEHLEVDAPTSHVETEAELAGEKAGGRLDADHDDVAATVARHRREASKRPSAGPVRVGTLMADFMAKHGRGMDGKPLPGQPAADDSMEL